MKIVIIPDEFDTGKLKGLPAGSKVIDATDPMEFDNSIPWFGVDLDGTLAKIDSTVNPFKIGEPIEKMLDRVKKWINDGMVVKIFTARASKKWHDYVDSHYGEGSSDVIIPIIENWCLEHIGSKLLVTCVKDQNMIALWDDISLYPMEKNTGNIQQYCQVG